MDDLVSAVMAVIAVIESWEEKQQRPEMVDLRTIKDALIIGLRQIGEVDG